MKDKDERDLAVKAGNGNREALAELIDRMRLPLFRQAYAELRHYDDAQDVVASALLQIVKHIDDLRDTGSLRAWSGKIVRNEVRRFRNATNFTTEDLRTKPVRAPEPGETSLLRLDIELSLRRLPQNQALSFWLFYVCGLSIRQIGRRINVPEGTIKYWLHRGRERLAQGMEGYESMRTKKLRRTAAVISTGLDQKTLYEIEASFKESGWSDVVLVSDFASAGEVQPTGVGKTSQLSLPRVLAGCDCILLDEWIGGRSSFELVALYNACAERRKATIFCLLGDKSANPAVDTSVHAAYALGVDALLTKPFEISEFRRLAKRIYSNRSVENP